MRLHVPAAVPVGNDASPTILRAQALGVSNENVNKDLLLYKSILSKMMAAKELMAEMVSRDKRKQTEREAAKEAKKAEVASA